MRILALLVVLALMAAAAPPAFAQETPVAEPAAPEDPHQQALTYYQHGMAAYQRKDYIGYLENMQKAVELNPGHPAMRYRLACAAALVGNRQEAVTHLRRLVDLKVYQDLAGNTDFDAMRQDPEFQTVAAAMRAIKEPISRSTRAFSLTEKDLITEGIAYDPVEGDFYIGSVHKRKIVRTSKKGKAGDFTTPGQDGLRAVLGLKVDPARRLLWACSTGMAQMERATEEEKGRAALHAYNLATGALVKKLPLGGGAPGHNCNDLAVGPAGEVYVSDAESGEILQLPAGGDALKIFIETGRLKSPQGIALTADGKHMFVADYATTIFRVDLTTRELAPLPGPENLTLLGIDGLVLLETSFLVIQNGITPHRLVRLALSPGMDRITGAEILEMNNPLFDEPTLGTLADRVFYYIANSQWGRFTSDGTIYPLNRLAEPVVMKIKVD